MNYFIIIQIRIYFQHFSALLFLHLQIVPKNKETEKLKKYSSSSKFSFITSLLIKFTPNAIVYTY